MHPREPICRLLDGKYLPSIFLHAPITCPEPQRFDRRLDIRTKIRCLPFAEQLLDSRQLRAVAAGDGNFNCNGTTFVRARASEAAGECFAYLTGCEQLEGQSDSIACSISPGLFFDRHACDMTGNSPVSGPFLGPFLEDLYYCRTNIMLRI